MSVACCSATTFTVHGGVETLMMEAAAVESVAAAKEAVVAITEVAASVVHVAAKARQL